MKSNKLYVIDYYVNGQVKETINLNNPKPVVITKFTMNKLKNSTHKSGKLIRRLVN